MTRQWSFIIFIAQTSPYSISLPETHCCQWRSGRAGVVSGPQIKTECLAWNTVQCNQEMMVPRHTHPYLGHSANPSSVSGKYSGSKQNRFGSVNLFLMP